MFPIAALKAAGLISVMPSAVIYSFQAAAICVFLLLIANRYELPFKRQFLLTLGILFGTLTWTNLTIGGAWQLALGFAMVGELGTIWFTVCDRRPLIAGLFFALGFGNRTEVLLTAPIFLFLLIRPPTDPLDEDSSKSSKKRISPSKKKVSRPGVLSRFKTLDHSAVARFCIVPFVLGIATLVYNFVRFHSFVDFGYERIPGVLREPWYKYGIFSIYYVPRQAWEMLFRLWEVRPTFPYLVPNEFSSSILLSSPFLLFAFRPKGRDRTLKTCAWTAVAIMTFLLWIHGNSGGWQFGYRYAMILLPWIFVILLENSPEKVSPFELAVYIYSFLVNAYATWLFHWSGYVKIN
jgi:hypothetical protein